jgi:16S rRNA (cytidine1402-2'-O)-methyltransferase
MSHDVRVVGSIVFAATPIGNALDASERLRSALGQADVIAAEDTRRVRRLASALGVRIAGRVLSFFEGNERERAEELVGLAQSGAAVLVLSDAGMPGVSDPGYRLVRAAIDAGVPMQVLPGPSAVLGALLLSGLPSDRFCFEGFLPRQAGPRRTRLLQLTTEPRTMVFFESPHRGVATLAAMVETFGADRRAAACRELTKVHEEVVRGTLAELVVWAEAGLLGELTVVVAGCPVGPVSTTVTDLAAAVAAAESDGADRRAAITSVAHRLGVPRKVVYQAVLDARES